MDIRKPDAPKEEVVQVNEHATVEWLKNNKHLLGPFAPGQIVQGKGDGSFKTVDKPEVKKAPSKKETNEINPGLPKDMQGVNIGEFLAEDVKYQQEQLKASTEPKAEVPGAGAIAPKTHCQHCGWDQSREDPGPTEEIDKLSFLQAVLGQIPFKKSYDLLNGRLQIVFRTLQSEESDMTFTQIAWDTGRGEILDEGQYFRTMNDYRMVLSLSEFRSMDGKTFHLPGSIEEWQTEKVPLKATKLVHIVPWMYDNVLKSESVRRAVASCFFRFQRMVEHMEAHFDDPNFWPAIERQA